MFSTDWAPDFPPKKNNSKYREKKKNSQPHSAQLSQSQSPCTIDFFFWNIALKSSVFDSSQDKIFLQQRTIIVYKITYSITTVQLEAINYLSKCICTCNLYVVCFNGKWDYLLSYVRFIILPGIIMVSWSFEVFWLCVPLSSIE